jgi:hypothetical protein
MIPQVLALLLAGCGVVAWFCLGVVPASAAPWTDEPKPPIEAAFQKAATSPAIANLVWIANIELDAPASQLAKSYGPSAAPFLKERLAKGQAPEPQLAALTLAKLADDPAIATYLLSGPKELADRPLSHLIAYFPPKALKATLDKLLQGEPELWVLQLAGVIGETQTLKQVEQIAVKAPDGSDRRKTAAAAAAAIQRRLALTTASERDAWIIAGLNVWKIEHDLGPTPRNPEGIPLSRAYKLDRAGLKISAAFLKAHFAAPGYDPLLLVSIAGVQREETLVDDLLVLAKGSDRMALTAQKSLGMIGTDKALRGIEAMLTPGDDRRSIHNNIAGVLIGHGDAKSLAVLARVKDDAKFAPTDLQTFDDAHRRLKRRLDESKP